MATTLKLTQIMPSLLISKVGTQLIRGQEHLGS